MSIIIVQTITHVAIPMGAKPMGYCQLCPGVVYPEVMI